MRRELPPAASPAAYLAMSGRTRTHTVTAPSSAIPARARRSGTGTRDRIGGPGARNARPNRRRSLNCACSRSLLAREGRTPCVERTTRTTGGEAWGGGQGKHDQEQTAEQPRSSPATPSLPPPAGSAQMAAVRESNADVTSPSAGLLNILRDGDCTTPLGNPSKADNPLH